jgi:hypothetical protein
MMSDLVYHHVNKESKKFSLKKNISLNSIYTLSSMTAASGKTSKTELIASHTSLPSVSPNLPIHSL